MPLRLLMLLSLLGAPLGALAHEIPSDVTVHIIVKPEGDRIRLLVRAPLEAMQDVQFPTFGPGYLDAARADRALRNAALLWLVNDVDVYENGRRLPRLALVAARASIPSDRSFASYEAALAHVRAPPLPEGTELPWRQALLDVLLEAPIESEASRFAVHPRLSRLGLRVVNAVCFVAPGGVERVFHIEGDAGVVELDPRWHRAMRRFLVQGFEHILDGIDHLLFLLCLVVPFRRELRALVWIVTAFTAGHSVTLIGSAYGAAPTALWFPPLVETLIAASIFYMAVENAVVPGASRLRARWGIAFGFGLVHGFGFSFALQNTLQFAGDHVLTSLLSFNVGIELGQLLVLLALVPLLNAALRLPNAERAGVIVLSVIVGHTAWHWMAERFAALREFDSSFAAIRAAVADSALPWLAAAVALGCVAWLALKPRARRRRPTR
ncbi:MAG TPA: HupE/UreJ family protein [Gammaproteobacteria bacterium]